MSAHEGLTDRLAALQTMSPHDLRGEWAIVCKCKPPQGRSREILLRGISWQLQAGRVGGLTPETRRHLMRIGQAMNRNPAHQVTPKLRAGTMLVREWQGRRYEVRVLEQGFEYRGSHHRSLSQIARAITGTRWNGRVFFGLKKRVEDTLTGPRNG